jgi:hypothetical protein
MSPGTYSAEQYARWHKRTCARCGRFGGFAAHWSDGHICRTCFDKAMSGRGACPGCLVLLYAQPVSRIVRLTVEDIIRDGAEVLLRLGDPPTPVPEPFASLLLAAASQRQNMSTATNPSLRYLFPGRRAGQPINPYTLYPAMRELGIPTQAARTSAIRQLVLQAPAPVIAQALGYHPNTTHRHAADAGGIWIRYAPGDHTRSQPRVPQPRTPTT